VTLETKQEEHVPRHIELTAVRHLFGGQQKKESKRIVKDLKRTIVFVAYNITIYDEEFDPGSG
jgi:hypothetical protein